MYVLFPFYLRFTDELVSGIVKTLQKFAEHNEESFPERVILFRDGVTGGQLHQLQREAEDIKAGIENFYDNDLKG